MSGRSIRKRIRVDPAWDGLASLTILCASFFLGALSGFLFSLLSGESGGLSDYLRPYFQAAGQSGGVAPSLWSVIWEQVRWPLLAVILSYSVLGTVGIPLLLAVRGFLLSFAVASFGRLFGLPGLAAALAAFGLTALLSVPVLFAVSHDSFCTALCRLPSGGSTPPSMGRRAAVLAPCMGLLALAVVLQWTAMPALLSAVCARLFTS